MNVAEFLTEQHVPFNELPHTTTFTAQHTAQVLDVPGANLAKTVVIAANGSGVVAVLPASHMIDLAKVRAALDCKDAEIAEEAELAGLFPDCDLGAVPPFGSRYGLRTIVDATLTDDEYIVFDSNTHETAISMRYVDFVAVEHPDVVDITDPDRLP